MAFSTVPFALQNASHSAALFRQAISSLIPAGGGICSPSDLNVTQTGTPSMAVQIGVGRIWIPGTNIVNVSGGNFSPQAMYYAENESTITATITASDPTNPRIDVVYVAIQDSQYAGTNNQVSPQFVVTGTPISGASYPTNAPALPNNAIAVGWIKVRAGSTSILNSDITNLPVAVVGITPSTSYTPTLTAATTNPSLGTSPTVIGTYSISGTVMTGQFFLQFGTSPSAGVGAYQVSLPAGFTYSPISAYIPVGQCFAEASTSNISGYCRQAGSSSSFLNLYWQSAPATANPISGSTFAWASGYFLCGTFSVNIA